MSMIARVVEHAVRAECPYGVELGGARDGGDPRAEAVGELDGEGAHAAGGSRDEDALAFADPAPVADGLERRQRADGYPATARTSDPRTPWIKPDKPPVRQLPDSADCKRDNAGTPPRG